MESEFLIVNYASLYILCNCVTIKTQLTYFYFYLTILVQPWSNQFKNFNFICTRPRKNKSKCIV